MLQGFGSDTKDFETSDCRIYFVSGLLVTKEIKRAVYDTDFAFSVFEFLIIFTLFIVLKSRSPRDLVGFSQNLLVAIIIVLFLRAVMIQSQKLISNHADYLFEEIGRDKNKIDTFAGWLIFLDTMIALDPYLVLVTLAIITIFHVKLRSIEIQLIGNEASHTEHLI